MKALISIEKRTYEASSKMCAVVLNKRWKGFSEVIMAGTLIKCDDIEPFK